MRKMVQILGFLLVLPLALFAQTGPEQPPGTIEDLANPLMGKITAAHEALKAGADDIVLYYYRADGKYDEWGFWTWAFPGGDGAAAWDRTSKLKVTDGVGYLKFKKDGSDIGISLMGTSGTGLIPRRVDGWTKDGNDDRFFNTVVTNEWVVFSNDPKTYPYGKYRPSIDVAKLTKVDTIQIELSGRQALTVEPSSNGFLVGTPDGQTTYTIRDMFNTASTDRNKNFTRRITLVLDRQVDLTKTITVSNPAYQLPVVVNAQALAAQVAEQTVPPAGYQLGALYDAAAQTVEFRLWAPLSTAVTARIFTASEAPTPSTEVPLVLDTATGVWSGTYDQTDPDGAFYDYEVASGSVKKIVLDPYAASMDVFRNAGPGRGAIVNPAHTQPMGGWEGATDVVLAQREDAIIYEVSVRDLTIGPDSGVTERPGSYLAFIEKLPYLKSLGVTHLQLMPVLNFYYTDETKTAFEATGTSTNNNYNWGYDPHSYFSPEGWFSSNPADPYSRIVELKTLIKEAHKAGLGVLLDVVYNHTAKTDILNDIVPGYYYRMTPEGTFLSNSGVGNDIASERIMTRRLISDSINHWVSEYQVDGFRFDLMGLIDVDTILQSRARAALNPGKADVLFEGEGWKMYNGPKTVKVMDQTYMTKTNLIAVFNDEIRSLLKGGGLDDRAKGFITDKPINPKLILSNLLGQPQLNYKVSDPGNNLQYTEAHDNLTMHDNIALNMGLSDAVPEQRVELAARLRLGNFFVLTSQGIAFLHSGQESGRTKPKLNSTSEFLGEFIHNSYDAADNINAFVWQPYPEYTALTEYTAGLIGIRKAFQAFRLGDAKAIDAAATAIEGSDILSMGWSLKTNEGTFTMLVNAARSPRTFDVGKNLAGKKVLVDQTRASKDGLSDPQGLSFAGAVVTVEPLTAIMIKDKRNTMDFHKVETTNNFVFGSDEAGHLRVVDHGSSVFRLTALSKRWPRGTDSQAVLTPEEFAGKPSPARFNLGPAGEITLSWGGTALLTSAPGRGFGVCGPKWVFALDYHADDRFYGMGQKHLGLELSKKRTKFWNTDEFGDFPFPVVEHGRPDPSYTSFPVLIVKHQGLWAAVVIDNPHCVFMNTGAEEDIFQPGAGPFVPELFFGSRDGAPDVWFLADDTPAGLVRKIQSLQGRVAPPPVWALGHQQCRWGYRSYDDLKRIADEYQRRQIPNDGLWLDIDYMDGFRVFTVDPGHFTDVKTQVAELVARGHRVVPILDPGFRQDPAYRVYAEAKKADLLCQTPEGRDYVGYVWPGYTVFPDFSLPEAREFWAQEVKRFTDLGFAGYWIDMNDPATGTVPHHDMLFGRGKLPHSSFHNQYALGMAMATKQGIQASRPGERPFLISRSAYLSSSRHTAVWTGDNISNEHHMKGAISMSLNLSVSGMPFNGPDVPGFAQNASNELMRAWYKLGFLFPFLRNHKVQGAADQEPWTRDALTTRVVTDFIRLRYKLLPYLYQTFLTQAAQGDPILRPLWYHDTDPAFERTDDAFFVGPALLQAPFTALEDKVRTVTLPRHQAGTSWFDVQNRRFVAAGTQTSHKNTPDTTPLFLASPSVIPLQQGVRLTNQNEFGRLDVVLVLEPGTQAALTYQSDDGLTEAWRDGQVSRFTIEARLEGDRVLVTVTNPLRGFGGLKLRFLVLCPTKVATLDLNAQAWALAPETLVLAGSSLKVSATGEVAV